MPRGITPVILSVGICCAIMISTREVDGEDEDGEVFAYSDQV